MGRNQIPKEYAPLLPPGLISHGPRDTTEPSFIKPGAPWNHAKLESDLLCEAQGIISRS